MIQIWDLRMFFFEMGGSTISYSQPGFNWVQSCSKFYMMSGSQNLIKIRRFVCVCDSWIFSPSIRSGMVLIVGVVWLGSFRGMDFIDVGDYARKQRFCARFNLLTHQNWQWLHGNTYNVSLCTYNYHAKWGSHRCIPSSIICDCHARCRYGYAGVLKVLLDAQAASGASFFSLKSRYIIHLEHLRGAKWLVRGAH